MSIASNVPNLAGLKVAVYRPHDGPSRLADLCHELGATKVSLLHGEFTPPPVKECNCIVVSSEHFYAMRQDPLPSQALFLDLDFLPLVAPTARIVAISGSNGKTSTCLLLNQILRAAGHDVKLTGHLSTDGLAQSVAEFALTRVRGAPQPEFVICELAAHQAAAVSKFAAQVVCITNYSEGVDERIGPAKYVLRTMQQLLTRGEIRVTNADDVRLRSALCQAETSVGFGQSLSASTVVRWTQDGLWVRSTEGWTTLAHLNSRERLFHPQNIAAAVAVANPGLGIRVDRQSLEQILERGVCIPHRMESLGDSRGVKFINDAKSTSCIATTAGINLLDLPVILIIGGNDHGQPLEKLMSGAHQPKRVIVFGDIADRATRELAGIDVVSTKTLYDAFAIAIRDAVPGDSVLFSPAAGSSGEFRDYRQRGEAFRNLVEDHCRTSNRSSR